MRLPLSSLLCVCLAAQPALAQKQELEPSPTQQTLSVGAAVIPGLLVHGAGHYVMGDTETAKRLLLLEGGGLGLLLIGGGVLGVTGASRYLTAPAAWMSIGGIGLFGISFLADVYGVLAPPEGFGVPAILPKATLVLGGAYVAQPQFDIGWVSQFSADVQLDRWRLGGAFELSPSRFLHQETGWLGYRLWQPQPNANWLELRVGLTYLDHTPGDFTAWTGETQLVSRLGLEHISPTLVGAFVDSGMGVALRNVLYPNKHSTTESLLLAHFGFGVYVGENSEAQVYYNHRHDGFAAGLLLPGLPSGVAGHFGTQIALGFTPMWRVMLEAQVGSAVVASAAIQYRHVGEQP